jgi:hypothetical protein
MIGDMNVADVTDDHVLRILQPIWVSHKVTARALMNRIGKVISYAMVKGIGPAVRIPRPGATALSTPWPSPTRSQRSNITPRFTTATLPPS